MTPKRTYPVNPPAVFPKPKPRTYRGSDNPKARKPISTAGGPMVLVERATPKMPAARAFLGRSRSRRVRRNVWVSA